MRALQPDPPPLQPNPSPPPQAISTHLGNKTVAATRLYWSRHRERLGLDAILAERAAAGLGPEEAAPGAPLQLAPDLAAQLAAGGGAVGGSAAGMLPGLQAWAPLLDSLRQQAGGTPSAAAAEQQAAAAAAGGPAPMQLELATEAAAAAAAGGEPGEAPAGGAAEQQQQQLQEQEGGPAEAEFAHSAASLIPKEELSKLQSLLEPGASSVHGRLGAGHPRCPVHSTALPGAAQPATLAHSLPLPPPLCRRPAL